jgi:hypothetical protein
VDHQSIEIIGELKPNERQRFLSRIEVTSIAKAKAEGRTLALLRPRNVKFAVEKKPPDVLKEEKEKFQALASQSDLFNSSPLIPIDPCRSPSSDASSIRQSGLTIRRSGFARPPTRTRRRVATL